MCYVLELEILFWGSTMSDMGPFIPGEQPIPVEVWHSLLYRSGRRIVESLVLCYSDKDTGIGELYKML